MTKKYTYYINNNIYNNIIIIIINISNKRIFNY